MRFYGFRFMYPEGWIMLKSSFRAAALRRGALALAGATMLSALPLTSAEAQYYPHPRPRYNSGDALAGGLVGGVLGGLAAGALLNTARPAPVYVQPAPVYVQPRPVYEYVPSCRTERQTVWLDQYTYTHRRVQVCD
jgi:PXPV repeat (3 copies)